MKYTFLLPAFKGRFLDEMLRSIQGQTYRDYKVIISDDCSPEDLRSICEPYLADPRFTYRRNEENMGSKSLVAHWNLLVSMCDTEFLILASDDDVYEPQFLEEIDRLTLKYPDVDLFRARVRRINGEGNVMILDGVFEVHVDHLHFIHQNLLSNHLPCISNYCFRSKELKSKGGFVNFPKAWSSDDATIMMMAEKGCCNTCSILFSFRQSVINISSQSGDAEDSQEKVLAILAFHKWFETFFDRAFRKGYTSEPDLPKHVLYCHQLLEREAIKGYILSCRWKDFNRLARRCQKELSMSFYVLAYYWLRKRFR